jgi:hypothetical protein
LVHIVNREEREHQPEEEEEEAEEVVEVEVEVAEVEVGTVLEEVETLIRTFLQIQLLHPPTTRHRQYQHSHFRC